MLVFPLAKGYVRLISLSGAKYLATPVVLNIFSDICRSSTVPVVQINGDSVGFDRCAKVLRSVGSDGPSVARGVPQRCGEDIPFRAPVGIAAHGSVVFLVGPGWRYK